MDQTMMCAHFRIDRYAVKIRKIHVYRPCTCATLSDNPADPVIASACP